VTEVSGAPALEARFRLQRGTLHLDVDLEVGAHELVVLV